MPYNPPAFTADELLDAIRRAADLNELKRMIGPTVEQNAESINRLERMDSIFRRNEGISMDAWPCIDQDNYKRIGDEQGLFENQWC